MSDLTTEIRRLRRENAKLVDDCAMLNIKLAQSERERKRVMTLYDDLKSSSGLNDIFGRIWKDRN